MIALTHRLQIYLSVQGVLATTGTFYSFSKFKTSITYLDNKNRLLQHFFLLTLRLLSSKVLKRVLKARGERREKRRKLSSELSHQRPQLRETALITPFTSLYHHTNASKRVQVHAHTNTDILSLSLSLSKHTHILCYIAMYSEWRLTTSLLKIVLKLR